MDRNGHICAAMYLMLLVLLARPLDNILTAKEQLGLFISFIVFTAVINPDIDLTLPFIKHRGITHNIFGIVAIAAIIGGIGLAIRYLTGFGLASNILSSIMFGASFAWFFHAIVDTIHSKLRWVTWILLLAPAIYFVIV